MNTPIANELNLDVEAIVRKVMTEMTITKGLSKDKKKSTSKREKKSKRKEKTKKDKKNTRKKRISGNNDVISQIEALTTKLEVLRREQDKYERRSSIPSKVFMSDQTVVESFDDSSNFSGKTIDSTRSGQTKHTVGTDAFYKEVASRLSHQRNSICIQGDFLPTDEEVNSNARDVCSTSCTMDDFEAAFAPNDMRCLALVSHNEMKTTMKNFVIHNKHILKKFPLTGTQSTMKMLAEVFHDEPDIVFGPACQSGPLGGDAELVALMTRGELGGILFFQDPMSSHPHEADIQCLVRQAMVHNTLFANTPTTAMSLMEVFRMALSGAGKPELLPSFFFSLQSPTVSSYKTAQKAVIRRASRVTFA